MPKSRIEINRDECSGDGVCVQEAPKTFEIGDDGIVLLLDPEGDGPEMVFAAAEACPTDAIALFDLETGKKAWPKG